MSLLAALLLGLVQGITEFLPISSSGHLLLAHELFGQTENTLALDAVLHLATALALLIYFRRDWLAMLSSAKTPGVLRSNAEKSRASHEMGRPALKSAYNGLTTFYLLAIASLPAALAGFFLQDFIETYLRSPWIVVTMLATIALLMFLTERKKPRSERANALDEVEGLALNSKSPDVKSCKHLMFTQALFIGCLQAVALIPGTSRSGITIVAGMLVGLSRPESARFAFLLGTPITLAAGLYSLNSLTLSLNSPNALTALILAFSTAFLAGLLSIRWLLKFLNSHSLRPFALYRLLLTALTTLFLLNA